MNNIDGGVMSKVNDLHIETADQWVRIQMKQPTVFNNFRFYLDGQYKASIFNGQEIYLVNTSASVLTIVMTESSWRERKDVVFHYWLTAQRDEPTEYLPGDILVASDNVNEKLTGFVGHSAIVINQNELIESPGGTPAIVKDTIEQFKMKHPEHAHFRPVSSEMGEKAADYAINYEKEYKKNLDEGNPSPKYSYLSTQDLTDPWEYIYCSKLVWLAYYYGADYEIENDFLWMSPEDLYTQLSKNEDFEKLNENENMNF